MFVWFVKSIFTSCLWNSPSILAFRKGFERGGIRLSPMGVGQVSHSWTHLQAVHMLNSTLSYKLALQCATYSYISNDLKQLPLFCWVVFSVVGWPTVIQVVFLARFQCSEIIAANSLWEDSDIITTYLLSHWYCWLRIWKIKTSKQTSIEWLQTKIFQYIIA